MCASAGATVGPASLQLLLPDDKIEDVLWKGEVGLGRKRGRRRKRRRRRRERCVLIVFNRVSCTNETLSEHVTGNVR